MKKKLSILAAIPVMALMSCGTASGTKSADDVRAFAGKFTIGTTSESTVIDDALSSFGMWSKAGQLVNGDEFMTYQTKDGDVTLHFAVHCNDGTTNCIADGYLHDPSLATRLYSGVN